ncbi:MAG: clostripain-related cysteine peptidase [Clostridia bacterium]
MMKTLLRRMAVILCCALMASALGISAPYARAQSGVTLMVYVCGSDLEHWGASASSDIDEIVAAQTDGINVIIQTGGSMRWKNARISSGTTQRFMVENGELQKLDDLGKQNMAEPDTLTDFISFCAQNYPAQRNMLILWDHGGGSLYGFASDELFDGDSMSVSEIGSAINAGNVKFDFIGFDACLMATYELGLTVAPYADYLIASENTEPAGGWVYSNWLSTLAAQPDTDTLTLGQEIIDDYIQACNADSSTADATLSMIDLAALSDLASSVDEQFAPQAQSMVFDGQYASLVNARDKTKSYGYDEHGMVDFINLIELSGVSSADDIVSGLQNAVVYNGMGDMASNSNGIAVYFPYSDLSGLESMQELYELIDNEGYYKMLSSFATVRSNGNSTQDFTDSSWYLEATINETDAIVQPQLTGDEIELLYKDDNYVLRMADEDWELIVNVQLQANVFDDEGQILLGRDDVINYARDEDGDVPVEFDNTWVALDGQLVPFYSTEYTENGDKFRYSGYVPVEVDGENMQLFIIWDNDHPEGRILGLRPEFADSQMMNHGLREIAATDELQAYCEYFADDSNEETLFYFGNAIVGDHDIAVSYEDIGEEEGGIRYVLTDLYGNEFVTETLYF